MLSRKSISSAHVFQRLVVDMPIRNVRAVAAAGFAACRGCLASNVSGVGARIASDIDFYPVQRLKSQDRFGDAMALAFRSVSLRESDGKFADPRICEDLHASDRTHVPGRVCELSTLVAYNRRIAVSSVGSFEIYIAPVGRGFDILWMGLETGTQQTVRPDYK
jgi:hypothetical protein